MVKREVGVLQKTVTISQFVALYFPMKCNVKLLYCFGLVGLPNMPRLGTVYSFHRAGRQQ